MISDDPPPMSNITVERASLSARSPTPAAARWASVSRSTISSSMPSRSRTVATKAGPLAAERQASVAMVRARVTPARRHLVAANLQRLERARDRRFAQASGQRQPLAQANDARERIDDPESLGGRPRDQQPAIVGAQIQRRISPAPAIAARRPAGFRNSKTARETRAQNSTSRLDSNQSPPTPPTVRGGICQTSVAILAADATRLAAAHGLKNG